MTLRERYAAIAKAPWFRAAHEGRSLGESIPIEPEQRVDFFGPIDLGMWSGPGWQYVRELHESEAAQKPPHAAIAGVA